MPLESIRITSHGAVTYATHLPWGLANTALAGSRVALAAWVRSGWHAGNPRFTSRHIYSSPPEEIFADLTRMFAAVAKSCAGRGVPVTVILLPDAGHLRRGPESFVLQDRIGPALKDLGLDVLDPRRDFLAEKDWRALFVNDYHFSRRGYDLMLTALLAHLRTIGIHPEPEAER